MPEKKNKEVTSIVPASAGAIERQTALQRYLSEVRNHPLLTKEEERELAFNYKDHGDLDAARTLVTSNLRLVVKIALEYHRNWMDLLDLIQEGNLGLMQAVKKFDPYKGNRLSTYSSFWIKAYILKFLMDNWRLVKIGTTQAQRKLFYNLKKEKNKLEQLGYKPDSAQLAKALDVKKSDVIEMEQRLSGRDERLDQPVDEDNTNTRGMILSDQSPQVDNIVAEDEFIRIIKRKLKAFREDLTEDGNDKEIYIFEKRLLAEDPMTLQQVGDEFGVSRERIRQIEAKLIEKLKEYLKKELPDYEDFDFVLQ
jgi:RNA polymerase sigma-32 factor